jgi:hypothetical protein
VGACQILYRRDRKLLKIYFFDLIEILLKYLKICRPGKRNMFTVDIKKLSIAAIIPVNNKL